ncbi:hypothetical protein MA16_Dca021586 [Dendrobium catenatum]|uniref:Uncharacterized protein n=1 Tax=Dendrobium catenatum TaxID=906689 RepID=A0A2I0VKL7_9ASPA|nr:hypothetical protein MA16_Dca021586 [Dendrobium catenatum]
MQHLRIYALRGEKYGNGYLISDAHFLPNGNLHDILISFDGEEREKMTVAVDNKIVSKLDIKDKLEGATEFYLNYDDGQCFEDDKSVTDAAEPRRFVRRRNQLTPEHTLGQGLQQLRNYAMWATKHENGYLISEAHFLPNGNLHDIVINFNGEERTNMSVAIDNNIVIELDIRDKLEGTTELYLNNGLVIDFQWELLNTVKHFGFYTKSSSHIRATGNTSNNSSGNGQPASNEDEFEDRRYNCWLDVYAAE